MRISLVLIARMLMPSPARSVNILAATPACERMPRPTIDTFTMSESYSTRDAPMVFAWPSMSSRTRDRSVFGTVNVTSVESLSSPRDGLWMIMSTETFSFASAPKSEATAPGRSGTAMS